MFETLKAATTWSINFEGGVGVWCYIGRVHVQKSNWSL
jgi:hypothetical protein